MDWNGDENENDDWKQCFVLPCMRDEINDAFNRFNLFCFPSSPTGMLMRRRNTEKYAVHPKIVFVFDVAAVERKVVTHTVRIRTNGWAMRICEILATYSSHAPKKVDPGVRS